MRRSSYGSYEHLSNLLAHWRLRRTVNDRLANTAQWHTGRTMPSHRISSVTTNLAWLPDHHLPVAATLAHADDLIGQVGELLFACQSESDGLFELREESDGVVNRAVVASLTPIPRKLPMLVADALVALRGALEHTLFAEIVHRDGVLGERVAKLVEMPARSTRADFDEWKERRDRKGPPSLSANGDLMCSIESLQPFQRVKSPADHPLARLASYTNHAKHRTPAVAAVMLPVVYREDQLPKSFADLPQRDERPLQIGEVVFESPVGDIVPLTLHPTVGLNRPGTDLWPVLMHELRDIAEWVRMQAVPRLITGGDPPTDALPASFDISVGHDDERRAIAEGSHTTGFDRQLTHLTAAKTARPGLIEIVGMTPGAPSLDLVRRWANHLTDEQAVEKAERLEAFRNITTAADQARAMGVVDGLPREAQEFVDEEA